MRPALSALSCLLPSVALAAPPHPALDHGLSPAAIEARCDEAIRKAAARLDALAAAPDAERTFKNTPREFDWIQDDLSTETAVPTFLKYVSTDKAARDAGHACETKVEKFLVDIYGREDLYRAMKTQASKGEPLGGDDKKLAEKTLLQFRRNGLELPPVERERVKMLKKQLVELELQFGQTLNEIKDFLPVTREELAGLPDDFIGRLDKLPDGKLKVTLDYPDYMPFMRNAKDADARRRLESLYNNRGFPSNVPMLEEAIRLRHRVARLLAYDTHANYVLEERMAKEPKAVREFLKRLERRLRAKAQPEIDEMLALKKRDDPGASKIFAWDFQYYDNELKKTRYALDDEKIKEYFPLDTVTEGMLDVYQGLLDVRFSNVEPAEAWHPDVRRFEVRDRASGTLLGHFYMDLFPREGKYKHAAAFTLIGGRRESEQDYRPPVSSIVANFNKPTADAPSLLKHSEVETYFHEFGHIMHQVLTRSRHPRFAGTRVARDFVEAPSQMLENWVWDAEVLKKLSGHYKDPSSKLPEDLLKRMLEAKNLNSGLKYLRQVFYASVDMAYHTAPEADSTKVYREFYDRITMVPMSEGVHPQAGFGHLMGGYDASYYGYLWSEVFSADMFARFEKEGVLNGELGRTYRSLILEPGGSLDEGEQLRRFLGREPTEDAFLKSIGLQAAPLD